MKDTHNGVGGTTSRPVSIKEGTDYARTYHHRPEGV